MGRDRSTTDAGVERGKRVDLLGRYGEYSGSGSDWPLSISQIQIDQTDVAEGATVMGDGVEPTPVVVTETDVADDATAELHEGALITVPSPTVTNVLSFGEVEVTDGTSTFVFDDELYDWTASYGALGRGDTFESVTGALYYSFSAWKREPRDATDFVGYVRDTSVVRVGDLNVGDLIVTEAMFDMKNGSEDYCEWIEVCNATGTTIDLGGLEVGDDDSSRGTATSVELPAGGYGLLLKPDAIPNSGDAGTAADCWQLTNTVLDGVDNDTASNWCEATTERYTDGTNVDYGTPGAANDACGT